MSGVYDDAKHCLWEVLRVDVDGPPEQREIPSEPAGDQYLHLWRQNGHGIPVDVQREIRERIRDRLTTLYPEPGTLATVSLRAEPGERLAVYRVEVNPERSDDFGGDD